MPTVESVLRDKTHKGDVEELEKRVFYTLTDHKDIQSALTAKAFALLMRKLHDKGIINDKDVDDLLLEVVT